MLKLIIVPKEDKISAQLSMRNIDPDAYFETFHRKLLNSSTEEHTHYCCSIWVDRVGSYVLQNEFQHSGHIIRDITNLKTHEVVASYGLKFEDVP